MMEPPSITQDVVVCVIVVCKDVRRHDRTAARRVDLFEGLAHMLVLGTWNDAGVKNIAILVENREYGGTVRGYLRVKQI